MIFICVYFNDLQAKKKAGVQRTPAFKISLVHLTKLSFHQLIMHEIIFFRCKLPYQPGFSHLWSGDREPSGC
jgi:hypothetical protein